MGSSSRVGYDCGEHDYNEDGNSGLHHLHLRGEKLDEDGWGEFFPANGYFRNAAEMRELRKDAAAEVATLPPADQVELLRLVQKFRTAVNENATASAPGQRQHFDNEMQALVNALTGGQP